RLRQDVRTPLPVPARPGAHDVSRDARLSATRRGPSREPVPRGSRPRGARRGCPRARRVNPGHDGRPDLPGLESRGLGLSACGGSSILGVCIAEYEDVTAMDLVKSVEAEFVRSDLPDFQAGDTIRVAL